MKTSRTTVRDRCSKAISGVKLHLANEPAVPIDGTSYAPAALETRLQTAIDSADATVAARGKFREAVVAEKAQRASILALLVALQAFVVLKFGKDAAAILADFGFTPRKQTQRSANAKAMAAAKARATRAARGTKGSVQKKAVKGTVTAVTITASGATTTSGSTEPSSNAAEASGSTQPAVAATPVATPPAGGSAQPANGGSAPAAGAGASVGHAPAVMAGPAGAAPQRQ